MKVVILKRDKVGDMLLVTPMLEHLRRTLPQAEIHMLANDYNAWVLEGNHNIDRLWVYPRVRHGASLRPRAVIEQLRQLWQLRRERFDLISRLLPAAWYHRARFNVSCGSAPRAPSLTPDTTKTIAQRTPRCSPG